MIKLIRYKVQFILMLFFCWALLVSFSVSSQEKHDPFPVNKNLENNIVFYEGFEGGMPSGWRQQVVAEVEGWPAFWNVRTGAGVVSPPNIIGVPDTAAVGDKNLVFQMQGSGYITRITSPPIDLEFIVNPVLSFYHAQAEWEPDQSDILYMYYRKGDTGPWQPLRNYIYPVEEWTERSISLADHESDRYYIMLEGISLYGSGICIDEFTITETGVIPKELNSIHTEQASLNFIPTSSVNNPILKSTIRVTGNDGNLTLDNYTAHSLNTNDADITGVKLYYTEDEVFSASHLVAQASGFTNGAVTFDNANLDLPTGYSYLWLAYDVSENASHGNFADALIPAGGIVISGNNYPETDQSPFGRRTIFESIFYDDFDTNKGWILTGEWERAVPQGLGGNDPDVTSEATGHAGASFPFVGSKILGTDITGLGNFPGNFEPDLDTLEYVAISPSINCFYYKDVTLSFHRWLNTDPVDKTWIHISTDEGVTWQKIWVNNDTFSAQNWSAQTIQLPTAIRKSKVRIRFGLGPTDIFRHSSGWNIDNLVVTGTYVTHDVGVVSWIGPNADCGMSDKETVVVKVENFGAWEVTDPIPLGFSLDGGVSWHMDTLYQNIPVGGKVNHTFIPKADFSVPGRNNNIIVKTFWEQDQETSNDKLNHSVFSIPYITPPYSELFAQSDGLWTGYGQNSSWNWGEATGETMQDAHAGTKAWYTNPVGTYNPMEKSWLESPCFNFSHTEHPVLEFYLNVHTAENTDALSIQYSIDKGNTWLPLSNYDDDLAWGWYTEDAEIIALQNAFSLDHGWHGDGDGWKRVRAVLDANLAQKENVKFRMVFATQDFDPAGSQWEGIGFDAVSVFEAPHDIGVTAIVNPVDACELSDEQLFTLRVENFGLNILPAGIIIPIGIEIGEMPGAYQQFELQNDLHPGASKQFAFDSHFDVSKPGNYLINAFTMLPGDTDFYMPGVFNDTLYTNLTVFGYPNFSLGDDIYTTDPDTLVLDAGDEFVAYLWQDNSTEQTHQVESLQSAFYSVMVTDIFGCSTTDSLEIIARDITFAGITEPQSNCELSDSENIVVHLLNSGPDPYAIGTEIPVQLWFNNMLYDETTILLEVELEPGELLAVDFQTHFDFSQIGEYKFQLVHLLKDADPGNDIVDFSVFVQGYPQPYIGDTIYTQNYLDIILDAGNQYISYYWQDGSQDQIFSLTNPYTALYSVVVTDQFGCEGTDSVLVVTYDIEIVGLVTPIDACELSAEETVGIKLINHGPETLMSGSKFPLVLEYQGAFSQEDTLVLENNWEPGHELEFFFSSVLDMQNAGIYEILVYQKHRDALTSNDSLYAEVAVHGFPEIYLPPFISTTTPAGLILNPGEGYHAYLWHDESSSPTFLVEAWGEHSVQVSNDFGCSSNAVTTIYPEIFDLALNSIVSPSAVCDGANQNNVVIRFINSGWMPISAGTEIIFTYAINGGTVVQENVILTNMLLPGDVREYRFNQTFDTPQGVMHSILAGVFFEGDEVAYNNNLEQDFGINTLPQPYLGDNIYTTDPLDILLSLDQHFESYVWQDGSTESTFQINSLNSQTYSVTVTDMLGCSNTSSIDVVTYNLVMDSIISPRSYCVLSDAEEVVVKIYNHGYDDFEEGDVLRLGYGADGQTSMLEEDFVLDQPWPANTHRYFRFQQQLNLSNHSHYDLKAYVATPNAVADTDSLISYIEVTGRPQVHLGLDIYTARPDTIMLDAGPGFASYFWHDGKSQQTYQVASYGWKWVFVTDEFGCMGSDTIYVGFYTDVWELENGFQSSVYPNPANEKIYVELDRVPATGVTVEISDLNGRAVIREDIQYEEIVRKEIDINALEAGVYFVNITSPYARKTHKVTIIR